MSEEKGKYIADEIPEAIEMLGKGYDAGIEIHPESRVITGTAEGLREYRTGTWIKLSTSFRDVMKNLKGSRLAVFLCLCLHIDSENNCFPSHETIAEETGYSKREIIESIKELEKIGFLTVRRGEKRYNFYHVNVAAAMGAETAPVHFGAKNSAVSAKNMSQTALKEEPIKTEYKKTEKKGDLVDGVLFFAGQAKEQQADKVEEVIQTLERGLRVNIARTTGNQAVAKRIVKDARPLDRFLQWVHADEWRAAHTYLYAELERVWRDFPQAFPNLLPSESDNESKGSFYG